MGISKNRITGARVKTRKPKGLVVEETQESAADSGYADFLADLGLDPEEGSSLAESGQHREKKLRVVEGDSVWVSPPWYPTFRRMVVERKWAVCLEGDPATGKTAAGCMLGKLEKAEMFFCQGSGDSDKYELVGDMMLKDGNTCFVPAPVVASLRYASDHPEKLAILLMDEINGFREMVQIRLNMLIQRDVNAGLVVAQTGEFLRPTDNWRLIATMNAGLAGTRPLIPALKSRFVILECDTLPPAIEQQIIASRYPDMAGYAARIVECANQVRKAKSEGQHEFACDLRTMFQWAEEWYATDDPIGSFKRIVLPKVGDRISEGAIRDGIYKSVEVTLSQV